MRAPDSCDATLVPPVENRSIPKFAAVAGEGLLVLSALSALGYLVTVKGASPQDPARATAWSVLDGA